MVDRLITTARQKEEEDKDKLSYNEQACFNNENRVRPLSIHYLNHFNMYDGPKKYLCQKDAPIDVDPKVIKKLFIAMDSRGKYALDDRIQLEEMKGFAKRNEMIHMDDDIIEKMYYDAIRGRKIIHQKNMTEPLTLDEVAFALRGWKSYDTNTGSWSVKYKPYRKYWIRFLLQITPDIFAQ